MSARIRFFEPGMRVLTPTGRLGRVEFVIAPVVGKEMVARVLVRYFDARWVKNARCHEAPTVLLQGKLLRPYEGEPVMWPDERFAALRRVANLLAAEDAAKKRLAGR